MSSFLDLQGIQVGSRLIEPCPAAFASSPWPWPPSRPCPTAQRRTGQACPPSSARISGVSAKRLAAEGVKHRTIRGQAVLLTPRHPAGTPSVPAGKPLGFLPVFDRFAAGFAGGCAADEVVVHELGNDDLVVATVTAFEVAGRVSLYQSARLTDRRWRDATTVLLAAIIDDACARGLSEVDFLRGDEPYKRRFAPNQRQMLRLVAGQGVVGLLGGFTWAATSQATQTAVRCVRFGEDHRRPVEGLTA